MKTQNEFEKKDWMKTAKAFAKQAYGKKKLEAIERERHWKVDERDYNG